MPKVGEVRTFIVDATWKHEWVGFDDDSGPWTRTVCYYMADEKGLIGGNTEKTFIGADNNSDLIAFTKPVVGLVVAKCRAILGIASFWEPIGEFDTKKSLR